jgi:dolichol-phosphate mannosyltransferase
MRAIVILPSYNEAENVLLLSADVLSQDDGLDVVVVDDNSPDGTADLVSGAMDDEPRLHLVKRAGKLGLGSAYQAGFEYALANGYDLVFTMDCDYSHHPKHLPQFLEAVAAGNDMVVGSRYVPGGGVRNWPKRRILLSRFANLYTRLLLRVPVYDCTAGYRCYSREVLETVNPGAIRSSGYAFLEDMVMRVHRAGFQISEVPIIFEDRTRGASKINHSEIYLAAWHVLKTAFYAPAVNKRVEAKSDTNAPR